MILLLISLLCVKGIVMTLGMSLAIVQYSRGTLTTFPAHFSSIALASFTAAAVLYVLQNIMKHVRDR